MHSHTSFFIFHASFLILLFLLALALGSVSIPLRAVVDILLGGDCAAHPSWGVIVRESRFPAAVAAVLAGASLAAAGLLLQTAFRNPLAGPSILGLDAGANLGVALVMLTGAGSLWATEGAALAGAAMVLAVLLAAGSVVRGRATLLIVGLMVSYMTSSLISLLQLGSQADALRHFVVWGMGNLGQVTPQRLPYFAAATLFGLALALALMKPLGALLLGENYAASLGLPLRRVRLMLLVACALLAATTTAFCGPIAFIGLAVPHLTRLLLRTANPRLLLPATLLTGASLTLLCHIITSLPPHTVIPINVITPLIGAPTVIYIIVSAQRK